MSSITANFGGLTAKQKHNVLMLLAEVLNDWADSADPATRGPAVVLLVLVERSQMDNPETYGKPRGNVTII